MSGWLTAGRGAGFQARDRHSQTRTAKATNRATGISLNALRLSSVASQCGSSGRILPGKIATVATVSWPISAQSSREAG